MKKATLFLLLCVTLAAAVPLETWRLPWLTYANRAAAPDSFPVSMFNDAIKTIPLFSPAFNPDSIAQTSDGIFIEPALIGTLKDSTWETGDHWNAHLDMVVAARLKKLSAVVRLDVDRDYPQYERTEFPWKKDRVAAGRIEDSYLEYAGNHAFARIGRLGRNWGPFADRSVILSSNTFNYDALEFGINSRLFEFRHLFGAFPEKSSRFDSRVGGIGTGTEHSRYISAHALNLRFGTMGSFGLTETVIFSKDNGVPDLQYVNPISIYTVTNTNGESEANLMLGVQGWVHPYFRNVTLRAQACFDDIQVDNADSADLEPTHWACDFGLDAHDMLPLPIRHFAFAEYTYASKWVYTVSDKNTTQGQRYTYLSRSLGLPTIDGDRLTLGIGLTGKNYWAGTLGFSSVRQDTNSLSSSWGGREYKGYRNETSLADRAKLNQTLSVFLEAMGYYKDWVDARLLFENRFVRNRATGDTDYSYDPSIRLTIGIHKSLFKKISFFEK